MANLINETSVAVLIPVGSILAFGGEPSSLPDNWKLCNGGELEIKDYDNLWKAIGKSWGYREVGGDKFLRLPNLQGMFLRGVSGDSDKDPNSVTRHPQFENGNSGNSVGSIQEDDFKSHQHPISPANAFMNNDGTTNSVDGGGDVKYTRSHLNTDDVGGKETRPVNAYVHYIIKVY